MLENKRTDSEILLYQTEDGQNRLEVQLQAETVWLSLNQLAELFQRDKSVISQHIKNVFEERELDPETTVVKFATVQIGEAIMKAESEFEKLKIKQLAQPSRAEQDFEEAIKKLPVTTKKME